MDCSNAKAASAYLELIQALGLENHLSDATESAKLASELLGQLTLSVKSPRPHLSLIEAPHASDWVILDEIPFYSLCEHHFVPFFGTAKIEYLPKNHIAGLGGFIRMLEYFSRMPQLQERLTQQLGESLVADLAPKALRITLKARQMCVELRKQPSIIVETHYKYEEP